MLSGCNRWQEWELDLLSDRSAAHFETRRTCPLQVATHARGTSALVVFFLTLEGSWRTRDLHQTCRDFRSLTARFGCFPHDCTVILRCSLRGRLGLACSPVAGWRVRRVFPHFRPLGSDCVSICHRALVEGTYGMLAMETDPFHSRCSLRSVSLVLLLGPSFRSILEWVAFFSFA